MRLIFAGSPEFSVPSLRALVEAGHDVVAVYSQPDRPAGRGKKLTASAVKQAALELGIPVYQPLNFKEAAAREELDALKADAMIVVAYGLILPQVVLDMPRYGCINVHASLLPRWRGAAPLQRAIAAGDEESGVTIMQMAAGLDTGDMLAKCHFSISDTTTGATLHDQLANDGAALLAEVLAELPSHQANAEPQNDELANYAHKLSKAEAWIDWQQPVAEIHRLVRAFIPWPGTQTIINGQTVKIHAAEPIQPSTTGPAGALLAADANGLQIATGDAALLITELQPAGKRRMSAADYARNLDITGKYATSPE